MTKDFSRAGVGAERGVRNTFSATLIQEYEDYTIAPSVLADETFRDELIALGLDPETGRGSGTVTAIEFDFERNTAAQPLDPRQGYVVNGHVEKAGQWLRGTFDYTEFAVNCADMCRSGRDSSGPTASVRERWLVRAPR